MGNLTKAALRNLRIELYLKIANLQGLEHDKRVRRVVIHATCFLSIVLVRAFGDAFYKHGFEGTPRFLCLHDTVSQN